MKILITGKNGQLGRELARTLAPLGELTSCDRTQLDLSDPDRVVSVVRSVGPDVIVNAGAYTAVDRAESERELAFAVNAAAPAILADEARRLGAALIHYSTDYVFEGDLRRPYLEDDEPRPLNAYGESKLAGERAVEAAGGAYLILRTSWVYSASGANFMLSMLRLARERRELAVVDDQTGSPTWARALAEATAALLRDRSAIAANAGIYHLCSSAHTSRYEYARAIVRIMSELSGSGDGWAEIGRATTDRYPSPAKRPARPVLSAERIARVFGVRMPHWEIQLRSCLEELARSERAGTAPQSSS